MIKKVVFALFVVLFASSVMAQQGSSCENPILVDSNYVGYVDGPCTLWYTASTFDLPLNVHFIPDADDSEWGPDVMVDLTCVPGVYDDPKVDSIIKMAEGFDIIFPVELFCNREVNPKTDKIEWDLFVDAMYREQLAQFGVTYNVAAFVKVTFYEAGKIMLKPDTAFASCMETAESVVLGDTISVYKNDSNRVFVLPYTDWQNDSIQFVWTGTEPAYVYLASGQCEFLPSLSSGYVWGCYEVKPGEPFKLSNKRINDEIVNNGAGGLFYGKVLSKSSGKLLVEKIPLNSAQGNAIELEYNAPISLKANDNTLYCFPKTWKATQFIANTSLQVKAYFSNVPEFVCTDDDAKVLAQYAFYQVDDVRELCLSSSEIETLTDETIDDYIYVRFKSSKATVITPYQWGASYCADKSSLIVSNKRFQVARQSSGVVRRLRYDDWKGYDMTISWEGSVRIPMYIADTCAFTLSSSNKRVVQYTNIKAKSTQVYDAATVDSWASRVDGDGFLYVRMNPTAAGNITFTSSKPEEVDPVLPDPVYTTINDTLCFGETYDWEDTTYTETGKYEKTFTAANGADSIVTLNLLVLPEVKPVVTDVTIDYGQTYEWNGKTYMQSASDTITLQDAMGCDYLAILKLTVMEKPVSPCVLGSIELKAGDQLTLNLDSAFTIYRVNYAEFAAQDRTLTWTGTTDLHTFVAETCTFAVAPYNKYVHVYVPVPAQGETLWTAAQWADLAAFVDEDGYLYLRFLTEKEGVLTVE